MIFANVRNNKIIDFNCQYLNEDITRVETTEEMQLAYEEDTSKVIYQDGEIILNPNYEKEQAQNRQKEFYDKFLATSKGNYRLQPKGYANAQQSVDTINGMVNALDGLTQQIAQMVIFYPTPDFTKEEECTEAWLVAHQYNTEPMTKEEWTEFYIEFSSLYAMNQYKKANDYHSLIGEEVN